MKEILIKEHDNGVTEITVKGFTPTETLGLLRLMEQRQSLILLEAMSQSDNNSRDESLVGFFYSNEHSKTVTVLSVVGEWCVVKEDGKEKPNIVPKEFVKALKNESVESLTNKR